MKLYKWLGLFRYYRISFELTDLIFRIKTHFYPVTSSAIGDSKLQVTSLSFFGYYMDILDEADYGLISTFKFQMWYIFWAHSNKSLLYAEQSHKCV